MIEASGGRGGVWAGMGECAGKGDEGRGREGGGGGMEVSVQTHLREDAAHILSCLG
jgi:hypothetical protein